MDKRPLNPNLDGLTPSATVAINERSNALLASGRDVIKLGLGQSPFPVPEVVVEALRAHASEKDYLPVAGLVALRDAVAAHHHRKEGIERSGDHVLIGPGSKELMFILQLAYVGELVIPAPSWVSYAPQARIAGRTVRWIRTSVEDRHRLTAEALDEACAEDPGRRRLLILNYPNNPTGQSHTDDELETIAEVARRRDVLILSDEIYGELHHGGAHKSIARHLPERTIVSAGLSKWCGAGGWRLGTFSFPASLRWLFEAMVTVASETFTSTSAPIQYAAVRAFEGGPEIDTYLNRSRVVLKAIGRYAADSLRAGGVAVEPPEGGFYLLPDFEAARSTLAARGIDDGPTLAARLLEDEGVAFLPGSDFGYDPNALIARLAYVDFDGEAALDAAAGLQGPPDSAFVRQIAPRVVEAIERIVRFVA